MKITPPQFTSAPLDQYLFLYLFQIDDDTLINPFQLVKFLSGQSDITMSELICKVTTGVGPIRDKRSKYFVSWKEYGESYYPEYCQVTVVDIVKP